MRKKVLVILGLCLVLTGCGSFKDGVNKGMDAALEKDEESEAKFGELLDEKINGNVVVLKVKIDQKPKTKQTIEQNYYTVVDYIINQGGNKYDEIQYWAVMDVSGSETKVISFTVSKELIEQINNDEIISNQLGQYLYDEWIHNMFKE